MAIRKIGDTGEFMDDLIQPKLLLIKIKREGDSLYLDAPGMSTLVLPAKLAKSGNIINCRYPYTKLYKYHRSMW